MVYGGGRVAFPASDLPVYDDILQAAGNCKLPDAAVSDVVQVLAISIPQYTITLPVLQG